MTEQPHDDVAAPETVRREGPWKLILIVAILTAVGVWLVPVSDDEPETPPIPIPAAKAPEAAAPSLLQPDGGSGEDATRIASIGDNVPSPTTASGGTGRVETAPGVEFGSEQPGNMARALIAEARKSGSVDLDKLYAKAREAQAEGQMADAYLLYFFGSRFGHAESALQLGTQADPATRNPDNSVFETADIAQAHKWYQVASQYGSTDGAERLNDLRARVEQMAADGDPRAQRTILLWQ